MDTQIPLAQQAVLQAGMPIISVKPVTLRAPERGDDLQVRISAPAAGDQLPVVVFSHGFGSSLEGSAPLADFWAAHGFVVIQPTHLDSRTLNLAPDDPRTPTIWRSRISDLRQVIDDLEQITGAIPGLTDRVDVENLAVAGHSWGATSASALAGARVIDQDGNADEDFSDPRVKAAVFLALAGTGDDLTPWAAENFAFMNPSFTHMTVPALHVAGDHDQSMLSTRGPDWWSDGFRLSPADGHLVTVHGAEHSLGGINGYLSTETTDENPARVALLQQLTTAYLKTALDLDPQAWDDARHANANEALAAITSAQDQPVS
jgi:predicted dienelactone hydrolase